MTPWTAILLVLASLISQASYAKDTPSENARKDAYSQPFTELNEEDRQKFFKGRSLVHQIWVVPPSDNADIAGLGPLYNRFSCAACHAGNGRGFAPEKPEEAMYTMLVRLSIPGRDAHGGPLPHPAYGGQLNENGVSGVPGEGRAKIHYTEHLVKLNGREKATLRQPSLSFAELAYGNFPPDIQTSPRIAPAIFGLGLLQAIPEEAILALVDTPKPKGIWGHVNRVWDEEQKKTVLGRFGWKANMPNLRQQIAGAYVGDMGITSPLFRDENCTMAEHACQSASSSAKPELSTAQLDATEFYHFALAPPQQRDIKNINVRRGAFLFRQAQCTACHIPDLQTGEFSPLPALSHQLIHPYTDLLLHDMGRALADNRPDYLANGREWRTAPLWGIGLANKIEPRASFLHDGRARNLLEAILWHGGEAAKSAEAVKQMSPNERKALMSFLYSL